MMFSEKTSLCFTATVQSFCGLVPGQEYNISVVTVSHGVESMEDSDSSTLLSVGNKWVYT